MEISIHADKLVYEEDDISFDLIVYLNKERIYKVSFTNYATTGTGTPGPEFLELANMINNMETGVISFESLPTGLKMGVKKITGSMYIFFDPNSDSSDSNICLIPLTEINRTKLYENLRAISQLTACYN